MPADGIYHLTAGGETTWFEFARAIVTCDESNGAKLRLRPDAINAIPSSDYPLPAKRPANSWLDCRKLATTFGLKLPD